MRQIVLDTETTGIELDQGHRIIEIGCVELLHRRLTGRHFHAYVNPEREVEEGAFQVHGIGNDFLLDKPLFARVAAEFVDFVRDAELLIHNAPFDIGFLDAELGRLAGDFQRMANYCQITDTLAMARQKHPGQRNTLDALCKRYGVDNTQRELHGALLDAEILADVYLLMTGGQTALSLDADEDNLPGKRGGPRAAQRREGLRLPVPPASSDELAEHRRFLAQMQERHGQCLWLQQDADDSAA
jgi:DNA polymerase-3 subunit epsilon